jgi:hypothetical protein
VVEGIIKMLEEILDEERNLMNNSEGLIAR